MCDDWMPVVRLPLSWQQFHQLPQNSAYKYEYFEKQAVLSPRPRHFHARLHLRSLPADPRVLVRPIDRADFSVLSRVFAAAFHRVQPFGSLEENARLLAGAECLEKTRTGLDGPWIEQASFVASLEKTGPAGAIFVTLLPDEDPCNQDSYYWQNPPPEDCMGRRLGRPHLTWIFVGPFFKGEGVGSALLAAAVNALIALGYAYLDSTFLLGNEESTLWHWRNGFELLPFPESRRRLRLHELQD